MVFQACLLCGGNANEPDHWLTCGDGPDALQAAVLAFRAGIRTPEGHVCPVCDRWARVHRRRITAGAASTAAWMFKYHGEAWVHVAAAAPKRLIQNREYNRLGYWDLLEPQPNVTDPKKRTLGLWRLTVPGIAWVRQSLVVPAWVEIYNDAVVRRADTMVPFSASMAEHFDYDEFLANL